MSTNHISVLQKEVVAAFSEQPREMKRVLDGTFGRGGHTRALLAQFPKAQVFGFDRDQEAVDFAQESFAREISEGRLQVIHDDFRSLADHRLGSFDGALFDLGVSSPQFDRAERGFSFQNDGPLDMRMDQSKGITAAEIVNTYEEEDLSNIFYNWGDIRHPNRVVRAIVNDRKTLDFTSTRQLASLIERVERAGFAKKGKKKEERIHLATPYFMALRIAVNLELENLGEFFESSPEFIEEGGRVVVISFHSLEDRAIKWAFRKLDGKSGKIITKKVITATEEEVAANPRSRSAKLRIFERGRPS